MARTLEATLQIKEQRAKDLIHLLMKWQKQYHLTREGDFYKMIVDRISDKREIAFLCGLQGKAMAVAEIADLFEQFTGMDLTQLMEKMRAMISSEIIITDDKMN